MITIGLYACCLKGFAAKNSHAVFPLLNRGAETAKAFRHCGDAVRFFEPELLYAEHPGDPFRQGGGHSQDRILIDRARRHLRTDIDSFQCASTNPNVRYRLTRFDPLVE